MKNLSNRFIGTLTVLYILTLGALYYTYVYVVPAKVQAMDPDDMERNENSTPRSFILPATPAVAEEQERKLSKSDDLRSEAKCIVKLIDLGYPVDSFDPSFNATLIAATYKFQSEQHIVPSGRLDRITKSRLGCL